MCIYDESANHPPAPDRTVPLPGVCAVSWSDEVRYPLATPITPLPSPSSGSGESAAEAQRRR